MNLHNQQLLDDFDLNIRDFSDIRDSITDLIKKELKKNDIMFIAVESRVKSRESFVGKLERKGEKYNDLSDITDLLGVRIINYYSKDVDKTCALLEKLFEVDWDNSQDKRKLLSLNKIGYLSIHYICKIRDDGSDLAKRLISRNFRFEIQIRTILQHMWAESEHDIFYKSSIEVPLKYKRPLNLLSGLLEMADEQFSNLITQIETYRNSVSHLIRDGRFEELELDGDTFSRYLELKPFDDLNRKIANINNMEIVDADLSKYLEKFLSMGFTHLADIENMKKKYSDRAYDIALLMFSGTDLDIMSSSVGVNLLCKAKLEDDSNHSQTIS